MDIAIARAATAVIQAMVEETWIDLEEQQAWREDDLERILLSTITDAGHAIIDDPRFQRAFGLETASIRARELWEHLVEDQVETRPEHASAAPELRLILEEGCLARRIVGAVGPSPSRERLEVVYSHLAHCLKAGEPFSGQS